MKKILITAILLIGTLTIFAQSNRVHDYNILTIPAVTSVTGTELIPILQEGVTKSVTPTILVDTTVLATKYNLTDTVVFDTELVQDMVLFTVGDTTVIPALGKVVYKTSDNHFYGCISTTATSTPKWKQLDN